MAWPTKNPWSSVGKSSSGPSAGLGGLGSNPTPAASQTPVSDPATTSNMKVMKAVGLPGKIGRPKNTIKSMTNAMTKSSRKTNLMKGY